MVSKIIFRKILKISYLFLLAHFFIYSNNSNGQSFEWPTNSSHNVGNSFGSYEFIPSTPPRAFHTGIDIPAVSGVDNVTAIADGDLTAVQRDLSGSNQFVFYFRPSSFLNLRGLYGHCDHDSRLTSSGLFPLYQINGTNISLVNGLPTLSAGQRFATSVNIPTVSYQHCHFNILRDDNANGFWQVPEDCLNPLDFLSDNNPLPGNAPIYGEMLVKRKPFGTAIYQKCSQVPYLFGNITIVREIRDYMGKTEIDASCNNGYCTDPDSWCLPSFAHSGDWYNGNCGAPYKIEWSIRDMNGVDISPINSFTFNDHPLDKIHMDYLYDIDRSDYNFRNQYCLRYNLTNIIANNLVDDSQWNTRVKNSFPLNSLQYASCIEEARFKDGHFKFHLKAEDKAQTPNGNNDQVILIDNFKPYVKQVVVNAFNNVNVPRTIYSGNWHWNSGSGQLELSPSNQSGRITDFFVPNSDQSIQIEITFSEPMKRILTTDMVVSFYSECAAHHLIGSTGNNDITYDHESPDHKIFYFNISSAILLGAHSQMQDIQIVAQDMAGSGLMAFTEANTTGIVGSSSIAIRDDNGGWINDDFNSWAGDKTHHFKIQGCFNQYRLTAGGTVDGIMSTGCLMADFSASSTNVSINTPVQFNDLTMIPSGMNVIYDWDFGDGGASSNQTPSHSYSASGLYNVSLTVSDYSNPATTDTKTKSQYIFVGCSSGCAPLNPSFTVSNAGPQAGEPVSFYNTTTGGTGTVTYQWFFGSGVNPSGTTSISPQGVIFPLGNFPITLTATDQNGSVSVTPITIHVTSVASHPPFSISIALPSSNGGLGFSFSSTISLYGYGGPYSYFWNFGDGSGSTNENPNHVYWYSGTYSVTLEVIDVGGQHATDSYQLNVGGSGAISNLDFVASPTFYAPDGSTPCGALVDFDATIQTQTLIDTYFWWEVINTTTNIDYGNLVYQRARFSPTFALAQGKYDVTLHAQYGSQTLTTTKSQYISICEPDPNAFTITNFEKGINCYLPYFDVAVSGGTAFTINQVLNLPIDPADVSSFSQAFGINPALVTIAEKGVIPNARGGYNYYIVTRDNAAPTTYPATVNYTLHMYENSQSGSLYNSITQPLTTTFYYPCMDQFLDPGDHFIQVCSGGHITLGGNPTVTGGTPPIVYSWVANGGTFSDPHSSNPIFYAPSTSGLIDIALSVSDGSGMTTSVNGFVTINVEDLSVSSNSLTACINSDAQQFNSIVSNGSGNYVYSWSPTISLSCVTCAQPSVTPQNPGYTFYTLTVTDASQGCQAQSQSNLFVSDDFPVISGLVDQYVTCRTQFVTLDATIQNINNLSSASWSGGQFSLSNQGISTAVTFTPFQTTTYTFYCSTFYGCTSSGHLTVFVDNTGAPNVNIGVTDNLGNISYPDFVTECYPNSIDLHATATTSTGGTPTFYYNWYNNAQLNGGSYLGNGSTLTTIWSDQTDYYLEVLDATPGSGCRSVDHITVLGDKITNIQSAPQYVCWSHDYPTLSPSSVNISCNTTGGIGNLTYQWDIENDDYFPNEFSSQNSQTISVQVPYTRHYKCKVTDEFGCSTDAKPAVVYDYVFSEWKKQNKLIEANSEYICSETSTGIMKTCFTLHNMYELNPTPTTPYYDGNPIGWNNDPNADIHNLGQNTLFPGPSITVIYGNGSYSYPDPDDPVEENCRYFVRGSNTPLGYNVWANFSSPCGSFTSDFLYLPAVNVEQVTSVHQHVCGPSSIFGPYVTEESILNPYGSNIKAMTISAGTATNCNYPLFGNTCSSTTIPSGKSLFFTAGNEINLMDGFTADDGSTFTASINGCMVPLPGRYAPTMIDALMDDSLSNFSPSSNLTSKDSINRLNEKYWEDKIKVYPNPTNGTFFLELQFSESKQTDILLEDIIGKNVRIIACGNFMNNKFEFSLPSLGLIEGVYIVQVATKDKIFNKKLVFVQ